MPTYHRSQRLRLVGTGPKVEQLQESRYRLTFTCTSTNPNEAWLNANKAQLFADYGTLQSAQMSISGISPRTDEAYPDMALTKVEANPSERDMIVTLVYETVDQDAFQKFQDDLVEVQDNGLLRVTQYEIGKHDLSKNITVGSTEITIGEDTCILSSKKEEVNDTFKLITAVYVESGILSTSKDNVGSQEAVVISKFEDTAPAVDTTIAGIDLTGYSLAKQEEGSVEGAKTYNYTFLKDNVQLSRSVDNQSPLLTETREYFKPDASKESLSGYSLINKQESNVDGIPTERYVFAKDNVTLSTSEDKVGSQLAIVKEVFNGTPSTPTGYSIADESVSSVDGIPTRRFRFLKNNVQLSRSVDNESPLKTEVREYFKPDSSKETLANYSLVNKQESNIDGIPTERYTFAKDNVEVSKSEDNVGSQLAIVRTFFNPSSDPTESGYSLAKKDQSNFDGIKTVQYTFLKENVQLSRSVDNESPLKTEIREYFKPDSSKQSLSGYSLLNKQESNVDGIPTERYTFAKDNVVLSVTQDNIGSQLAIVNEVFNPADEDENTDKLDVASEDEDGNALTGYFEADRSISNVDGIQTVRIRYLKENVQLSKTVDNESPLLTEVREYFKPDASKESLNGYSLVNKQESNVDGVPTERYTFAKDNVTLSTVEEKVGSQLAIVKEVFNGTPSTPNGYSIADEQVSSVDGIPTRRFRFLKNNVQLSKSVDNRSPLLTETREYFKPDASKETLSGYSLINKQESNVDGIPTERYTFAKDNVEISKSEDNVGSQLAIVRTFFNPSSDPTESGYVVAKKDQSDFEGIKTVQYTFLKENVQLSRSVDNESPLLTEVREYFKPDASKESLSGYSLVNKQESNVDGIPTERYVFAKNNVTISVSEEKVGSQNAVVNEIFKPSSETITGKDTDGANLVGYSEADRTESNHDGIKTIRVRFLKDNVQLSKSVDNQSALKTETREYFKPDSSKETLANYSLINKSESDVDGIPTERYVFAKDNQQISKSVDNQSALKTETREYFNPDASRETLANYSLINKSESNVDGIPTERYTFAKDNQQISRSVDNESPLKTETREYFKPDSSRESMTLVVDDVSIPYTLINKVESNVDGIPTERYTFAKDNVLLSVSEEKVGSQNAIVNEIFNPSDEGNIPCKDVDGNTINTHTEADRTESNHDGIKTVRVRFLENNCILSTSEDKVGSQKAVVVEKFGDTAPSGTINGIDLTGHSVAREDESNVDGIKTFRYTFLKPSILSRTDDKSDPARPITIVAFDKDESDNTLFGSENAEVDSDDYVLVSKTERDFEGIETFEMRFELKEYFLQERENEFGRVENVKVEQGGDYALQAMPGTAGTVNGTASSYIIAQEITEGIVPKRITTFSTAGIESVSEDLIGSTKVITITTFITAPSTNTAATYSNDTTDAQGDFILISDTNNRLNGVDVFTYKYAKNNAVISTSEDLVGSQKSFVIEKFGDTAPANADVTINLSGYSVARKDESNVEGIKTFRYTFLKSDVQLSVSVDNESPLKTEVQEWFDPDSDEDRDSKALYSLINEQESNVEGIPTKRFTFAKNNVTLFVSEEKVGSQNAIVNEIFKPSNESITGVDSDNNALSGYSEADRTESNYDGLKTIRVRFLKDNVQLSRSVDSRSSLLTETREYFKPDASKETLSGYSLIDKQESDVDGIPTERYTFAKPSIISVQREKNNAAAPITVRTFNLASDDASVSGSSGTPQVSTTTHILVSSTEEDFEGIKTNVFRFESTDYNTRERNEFGRTIIDRVEQSESSFSLEDQAAVYNVDGVYGLRILSQTTENNDNVVNRRLTKYTTVGIDEVREDIVGSQKAIVITKVGAEPTTTEAASYSDISYDGSSDWSIARKDNSRVAGLDVYTYTFLLDNTVLSVSEDKIGSQEAYVEEVFNPLVTIPGITISGGSSVAGDYFLGSSTYNSKNRYFTSDGGTYAKFLQYTGSTWEVRQFSSQYATNSGTNPNNADDPPETGWTATAANPNYEVENLLFRDFDDTLPSSTQGLSTSHRYEKDGYVLAKMDRSNVDGIPTVRYTFLRDNVILSNIIDESGVDKVVTIEKFNSDPTTSDANTLSAGTYTRLNLSSSNVDGIKTVRGVFLETGTPRVGSINPAMETEITEFQAYTATTFNDSLDNVGNTTFTLPDGGTLNTNAVVFEPTKDQAKKPTQFNQLVLDGDFSANLNHVSNTTPVLISQYKSLESFTYPGVVDITARYKSSTRLDVNVNMKETPTTALVNTTVYEFLQKGSDTVNSDFRYDGARGLWSPNEWGSFDLKVGGDVFTESRTYRGYRINRRSFFKLVSASGLTLASCKYQDQFVATGFTFLNVKMDIIQGPPDPVGKKWVLDVDISPFRRTVDGVQIYRKVIVVTDIIPSRVSNALSLS